jgi:hypothetical protein
MDLSLILAGFVAKYPILTTVLLVMGLLRAVNKPIMEAIRAFVKATPNPGDDLVLEKVEASKAYKAFCFALDWSTSIKIGPQAEKK